jgi:hypothetical protein
MFVAPWRTFRWYHGQKHYSGTYWSSTEESHVIYESCLELARLLYADFDGAVRRIVAPAFSLEGKGRRRHSVADEAFVAHEEVGEVAR